MPKTSIKWTEHNFNVVTGCNKVSPGCANCYAEGIVSRFWEWRKFTDVQFHPERLQEPLKRKKPTIYFASSMGDLFHDKVTDAQLDQIFAVMYWTPQHTYQCLTKRAERMYHYFTDSDQPSRLQVQLERMFNVSMVEDDDLPPLEAPYKNVWLGVSAENQETADERIPFLLATPASIKFLSCEPLLEPIDLRKHLVGNIVAKMLKGYGAKAKVPEYLAPPPGRLDWVIAGGESGRNARPCYLDWLRSLRDQCYSADVSYFVKQLGSNSFSGGGIDKPIKYTTLDSKGEVFDEFPEDLKIRETPKAYYND